MTHLLLLGSALASDPTTDPPSEPATTIDLGGIRAGYGLQPVGGDVLLGPAFSLNYAFQARHFQLGFEPVGIGWAGGGDDAHAFSVRFLRFEGAYVVSPTAPVSVYAGGGLGFVAQFVSQGDNDPGGGGIEIPLFAGVELLRRENIRFTAEAEGVLPTYRLKDASDVSAGWPISAGLRLGATVKMRRSLAEVVEAWIAN